MKYMRVKTDAQGTMDEVRVAEADKLSTGRYISVSLSNESNMAFDGSENISIGTQGTLPVKKGGTGATDLSNVTVGTAEKVANALTVMVNGEETEYDGSAAAAVTVSASNPNLLYNSNFAINQRGKRSYTSLGYSFDCWRKTSSRGIVYASSASFPINNSIYFSTNDNVYLRQYLERGLKTSTTYTITIGYNTTTSAHRSLEVSYTFTTDSSIETNISWTPLTGYRVQIYSPFSTSSIYHSYVQFGRTSSSGTTYYFHYIKLEEGSVATPYEIPNPATELLKCQRYYVKFNGAKLLSGSFNGGGQSAYVLLPLPATMRTTPSIVSYDATEFRIDGNRGVDIQSLSVNNAENGLVNLQFTTSGTNAAYQATTLFLESIELSAELTS